MRNKLIWFALLIGVVVVFYLSWLPHSKLEVYWFMPKWLGKWTDSEAHTNLRTAIPFLFIGGVSGIWLAKTDKAFKAWFIAWSLNVLVVTIAELGQLLIPQRSCDWHDIAWGSAGAFAGLLLASFSKIRFKVPKVELHRKSNPQYV